MLNPIEVLSKGKGFWSYDGSTYTISLLFRDFPLELLIGFKGGLINKEDMQSGFLCCEYHKDDETFYYEFIYEDGRIPVNGRFNNALWNDAVKKLANN